MSVEGGSAVTNGEVMITSDSLTGTTDPDYL
jgi:hypothetical protein